MPLGVTVSVRAQARKDGQAKLGRSKFEVHQYKYELQSWIGSFVPHNINFIIVAVIVFEKTNRKISSWPICSPFQLTKSQILIDY